MVDRIPESHLSQVPVSPVRTDTLTRRFSFSKLSVVKVLNGSILYLKGNTMVDFINTLSSESFGLFEGLFQAINGLFNNLVGSSVDEPAV